MTGDTEFPAPERGTLVAATAVVAATWFYFLIYVQHGLLDLGEALAAGEAWRERGLLTWLGTGGWVGSGLAAWRFNVYRWRGQLSWSLRACALAAAAATMAGAWEALAAFAALSGLSMGWLTVTLATGLRPSVGTGKLGWVIGLGTGIAYAAANLPFVFTAEPERQAILAAVVVAAVSVLAPFLTPQEPSVSEESVYGIRGVAGWLLLLTPVVVFTAAVFYRLQDDPDSRTALWTGSAWFLGLGLVHLGAGALAGRLLDSGWRWRAWLLGGALTALGVAAVGEGIIVVSVWVFLAGVSIFSATLLYILARGGRAWTAALVFVVAGWLGTAAGISYAQAATSIPAGLWPVLLGGAGLGSLLVGWAYRQPLRTNPVG